MAYKLLSLLVLFGLAVLAIAESQVPPAASNPQVVPEFDMQVPPFIDPQTPPSEPARYGVVRPLPQAADEAKDEPSEPLLPPKAAAPPREKRANVTFRARDGDFEVSLARQRTEDEPGPLVNLDLTVDCKGFVVQSTSDTEGLATVQVSATEPRILLPHGLEIHGHELQADMRDRRFEISGSEGEPVVLQQRPGARQALELEIKTAAKIVLEVREERLHLRIQGSEMTAAMTVPLQDRQLASGRYGSRE